MKNNQKYMQNRSNTPLDGEFVQIHVNEDFPVSKPDFNTRTSKPDVGPHIHDLPEIGYCYDGSGIFLIGNKILPFKKGDALFINNREIHLAKSNPGETTSWGFVSFEPERLLPPGIASLPCCRELPRYCGKNFRNIIDGETEPELAEVIRMILEELRNEKSDYRSVVRSLIWQLLLRLRRRHMNEEFDEVPDANFNKMKRLFPALTYLKSHMNGAVSIPLLASKCYMSEPNFRRLFHSVMGCSALSYIISMKLSVASTMLLNTDLPIYEIAYSCGFGNISSFNRQFQKKYKCTPSQWRMKPD